MEKAETPCAMVKQGYFKDVCEVTLKNSSIQSACKAILRSENG